MPPATTSSKSLPVFCAAACVAISTVSLLGWAAGIDWLTSFAPGLPRLVPMTAILFLLAGLALWSQTRASAPRSAPGVAAAALVAAGAVAILGSHAAQQVSAPFALGVDSYAFTLSSPVTAAMFLALGASLACMPWPRALRWGQWLALGLLLMALLTLAGYVFRDTFLYALLPGKGTSIPTTLAFILLALGVLALRPAEGMMVAVHGPGPSAWVTRRLLLSALAVPVLLGAAIGFALHLDMIDVGTAIAFLVWGMVALFTAVVWIFALVLQRYDAARRQAEREREAALEALREADARKDDFMALLAHELRNPLAPIRAAAEFLKLGNCDPAQMRRTSDIIKRQTDYMVHLVEDLLDVSRARRGLIALDKVPVDLVDAVGDAVEQVKPQMARRGHRLEVDLPERHPSVLGDHKRLVQVVANLLGNAAKYTPEGGHVRLQLRADDKRIEVEVRDDGIGIDAALLPRVFDSFTQGTRTAGRAEGGLGLGLALVKRLAELHGGDVTADSAGNGQGSTFVLTLPRMQGMPDGQPGARVAARLPLRS
ncbi:HAMP domain-containing sensor histidine kinase [Massilia sp. YIM B02763]|uniref:sensor histidine kinase n=1 Tax=Massilia sp. YIM B02763 TaxID=3050130 RepID=UPI0025B6D340|nr:HAMP domain-containing sensor histidine kinase [Massilia sp. YIM B02763]MDN4054485.1 HAMP domain-containing sensor histidine kinase [Massilia sp. YIM B02763]